MFTTDNWLNNCPVTSRLHLQGSSPRTGQAMGLDPVSGAGLLHFITYIYIVIAIFKSFMTLRDFVCLCKLFNISL